MATQTSEKQGTNPNFSHPLFPYDEPPRPAEQGDGLALFAPESGCFGNPLASAKPRFHKRLKMNGSRFRFRRVHRLIPDTQTTRTPSAPGIGFGITPKAHSTK